MRYILIIIITIFMFSCTNKKFINENLMLESQLDSIKQINKDLQNDISLRFYKLILREQKNYNDTTLIHKYRELLGQNEILDLYIYDRIRTITELKNTIDINKLIEGSYFLSIPSQYSSNTITKIKIFDNKCYLYNNNNLVIQDSIHLIYSSNTIIKAKFYINNDFGKRKYLLHYIKPKTIEIIDPSCVDCKPKQFIKVKGIIPL